VTTLSLATFGTVN